MITTTIPATPFDAMTGYRKKKILIVAYPKQGLINPSLRFANRLLDLGLHVTFSTSFSVIRRLDTKTTHHDLTFSPFYDGHDDGQQPTTTLEQFISDFTTHGVSTVSEIISTAAAAGKPFDHLVYTTGSPWAAKVAHAHGLESTLLWCQPAIVLGVYCHYFNGYEALISCNSNNPTFPINLPGLPSLTTADMPSFLSSSCPSEHKFIVQLMKEQIDILKIAPRVLVNTFDELEMESIRAIDKLVMIPVGPLIPSELLNGRGQSLVCDLFEKTEEDYMKWLNTKPKSSVVYVSFGSLATLSIGEADEMASGLLESGRPFLWVMRDGLKLKNIEVLKKQGMIVSWCSQVEVLNHQAVGCFLTHFGWNSTMEAFVAGIPTVGFPQWADQTTIAKMSEDVWKTGVRLKRREGDGVVEGKEIQRCVEKVMEDGEMRRNAVKWRELARQALDYGGSSTINLQAFLDGG